VTVPRTRRTTPELVVLDVVGPTRWVGETGLVHVVFAALGGVFLVAYIRCRDGQLALSERVTQWTHRERRDGGTDS
jgi:hypothetical protein